ncbi:MAG: Uma2 family endonuclease [Caldilineaceae bacterium]
MSTIILPQIQAGTTPAIAETPPLAAGDRLPRAEFERRYLAHPEIKKAELLEGIVYMPSPVKFKRHANPHLYLGGWITLYVSATPGVEGGDNATVRMDNENDPQPDILLRIDRTHGGHSFVDADDYLAGAPELIVEVASTSANYDMHVKKRVYARNGVQEYLVFLTHDQTVHWFELVDGEYVELTAAADGVLRSGVFPGLWLQPAAFWARELATMLAVLQEGIASPAHQAFVERLAGAGTSLD